MDTSITPQQYDPEGEISVTLSVTNGTLEVEGTFADVQVGNSGKSVTIQGIRDDVNAELASLEYTYTPVQIKQIN